MGLLGPVEPLLCLLRGRAAGPGKTVSGRRRVHQREGKTVQELRPIQMSR